MSTTKTVDDHVAEAFRNAKENGYTFEGWTDEQIAIDMCTCDSILENYMVEIVERAVGRYREKTETKKWVNVDIVDGMRLILIVLSVHDIIMIQNQRIIEKLYSNI